MEEEDRREREPERKAEKAEVAQESRRNEHESYSQKQPQGRWIQHAMILMKKAGPRAHKVETMMMVVDCLWR